MSRCKGSQYHSLKRMGPAGVFHCCCSMLSASVLLGRRQAEPSFQRNIEWAWRNRRLEFRL
jgi:hypothetical protein